MVTRACSYCRTFSAAGSRSPAGFDTTPVPLKAGLSQRVVSEQRLSNVACAGATGFETIAFGLEKFDGLGFFTGRRAREPAP
ncbi:MAG: hypothetical protein Ct9H300mP1_38610 [Planctomycetaceae bacterium]|nr:MAG: hypothetical protein Ct9H300mP1_38610 [Planctomycetaceae bacterium]